MDCPACEEKKVKKYKIVVLLILSHIAVFVIASTLNRHFMLKSLDSQFKRLDAEVALGRYIGYRDIVDNIQKNELSTAKCYAELGASSMLDTLRSCLADQSCAQLDTPNNHKNAPELFGEAEFNFKYIPKQKGIRQCGASID